LSRFLSDVLESVSESVSRHKAMSVDVSDIPKQRGHYNSLRRTELRKWVHDRR
jgi:hypothetical protein